MTDRQDSDREVLTSLPRTRPVRRSAKRAERPAAAKGPATAQRRKPAAKPRAAAASTARRKAPKTAAAKTAADAAAAATPAAERKARAGGTRSTRQRAQPPRVAPERKVPPAGYAAPTSRAGETPASGAADLIGTTLQAAAELTQIGMAVGRQTLRSMLDRLPKP